MRVSRHRRTRTRCGGWLLLCALRRSSCSTAAAGTRSSSRRCSGWSEGVPSGRGETTPQRSCRRSSLCRMDFWDVVVMFVDLGKERALEGGAGGRCSRGAAWRRRADGALLMLEQVVAGIADDYGARVEAAATAAAAAAPGSGGRGSSRSSSTAERGLLLQLLRLLCQPRKAPSSAAFSRCVDEEATRSATSSSASSLLFCNLFCNSSRSSSTCSRTPSTGVSLFGSRG